MILWLPMCSSSDSVLMHARVARRRRDDARRATRACARRDRRCRRRSVRARHRATTSAGCRFRVLQHALEDSPDCSRRGLLVYTGDGSRRQRRTWAAPRLGIMLRHYCRSLAPLAALLAATRLPRSRARKAIPGNPSRSCRISAACGKSRSAAARAAAGEPPAFTPEYAARSSQEYQAAHCARRDRGRPRGELRAERHAVDHDAAVSDRDSVHAGQGDDPHRGVRAVAADLHGRPRASRGSRSHVQRPLDRAIGKATRSSSTPSASRPTRRSATKAMRHSDKMRIVERFRLAAPDRLEVETTITDPEALTKPLTRTAAVRPPPRLDARRVRVPAEQPQLHDRRRQVRHRLELRGAAMMHDERRTQRPRSRVASRGHGARQRHRHSRARGVDVARRGASLVQRVRHDDEQGSRRRSHRVPVDEPAHLLVDQRHERRRQRRRAGASKA